MNYFGIDVSSHNGIINWKKVGSVIDFAIIRAGYGKNNIDKYAISNIKACKENKIPFGLYWFSYALNEEMAIKEAEYLCDIADKYKPSYPLCYDWEYDSDNNAKNMGIRMTNAKRLSFANCFLSKVKERGYKTLLYSNVDYLGKGFSPLMDKYELWLAHWGVNSPSRDCSIWQKSDSGNIAGINGKVDLNISYKNYSNSSTSTISNDKKKDMNNIIKSIIDKYTVVAQEIIKGKYGNGNTRRKKLTELGYDYDIAQMFVNYLLM